MEKFLLLGLATVKNQVSVPALVHALIVAVVTGTVTSWATVQRVDERLKEMITEVKEIRAEHTAIRERMTRAETNIDRNGLSYPKK